MKNARKLVVIDDHPLVRQGLKVVLAADSEFEVVGEAGDTETALRLIENLKPDLAIIDIHLPKTSGLDVIRRLQRKGCKTQFVVLTMSNNEAVFRSAIELGVKGYVLKEDAPSDMLRSLQAVAEDRAYVSPALSGMMLQRNERQRALHEAKPALEKLTAMEQRVLRLVAQNKTTRMIAEELFISPHTVESHRGNICSKLQLQGTQPLLRFALEHRADL